MFNLGRISLGLAILGGAAASHAASLSIFADSLGTYTDSNAAGWSQNETLLYPPSTLYPLVTNLTGTIGGTPQELSGTLLYSTTDNASTLLLDVTITGTASSPGAYSATGTWTYVSGTGVYAGFAGDTQIGDINSGSGSFTISQFPTGPTTGTSSTILSGALTPAPEPVSISLLGFGALALIRRKRASR